MFANQLFLILVSGIGVLHGILLAVFLWVYPRGNTNANKLLSVLLLIMSFRIGKSVFLHFADTIFIQVIFTGLSTLMLIGPLLLMYVQSVIFKSFLPKNLVIHIIPFCIAFAFGLYINVDVARNAPQWIFVLIFSLYYGHYLVYLSYSYMLIRKYDRQFGLSIDSLKWLNLLVFALAGIWVVYVLNLLEEAVPYVLGPVFYSLIAYGVSYLAIKNGYIVKLDQQKYKTTAVGNDEANELFDTINTLFENKELYKNPEITLGSLSKLLNETPQRISMVINVKAGVNFNHYINGFRVRKAAEMLLDPACQKYKIASIAYEVGFNSLNSFNNSFKKETGHTPSSYRSYKAQL
jgi:AraC-like DNA-binding protein